MTKKIHILLVALFLSALTVSASFAQIAPLSAPNSFADLAEDVTKAVVNVSTTQKFDTPEGANPLGPQGQFPEFPPGSPFQDFFEDFFNGPVPPGATPSPRAQSLGSGFVIDAAQGLVVTNAHVVDQADEVKIILQDDTSLDAEVLGKDTKTDLAVLKVTSKDVKLADVKWGDSNKMRVGDWILAVGNPFGLGGTVTAGIISARQRNINAGPYDDFIQTDASINRGNSGGPMFNTKGEVIGINTAIFSPSGGSVGIGFAVPSELAQPVIQQLIKYGQTRRGWLGVRIQEVSDDIAENLGLEFAKGALVASVTQDGPADKAGLKIGDVIIKFDGQDVEEMRRLPRIVADTEIGKKTDVVVWRNGKEVKSSVKVGQLEQAEENGLIDQPTALAEKTENTDTKIESLNLNVTELDDTTRQRYAVSDDVVGLIVTEIGQGSDAVEKGLIPSDVIVEVNQEKIKTIKDLQTALKKAKKENKSSVLLLVNSRGNMRFVALKIVETE